MQSVTTHQRLPLFGLAATRRIEATATAALAAQAQQSLNTWIVQAVRRATEPDQPRQTRTTGRRLTGWA